MISSHDEKLHLPTTEHKLWRESYYFCFYDRNNAIGGMTTIGLLPNQNSSEGCIVLYLPSQQVLVYWKKENYFSTNISIGKLSYKLLEPFKAWEIKIKSKILALKSSSRAAIYLSAIPGLLARDNINLNLRFESISPVFDYGLNDSRFAELFEIYHYEQVGKITGELILNSKRIKISALAHRDHSWGIRDWWIIDNWFWAAAQFNQSFAINCAKLKIYGKTWVFGFVFKDGKNSLVKNLKVYITCKKDEKPFSTGIEIIDSNNERYHINAKVLNLVPIVIKSKGRKTLVREALSEFELKDSNNLLGYGITEYGSSS